MKRKTALLLAAPIMASFLYACTGDTDGGSGADKARTPNPYVSDGGAGGALSIEVSDSDNLISVGDTVGFRVRVTAPDGSPQPFIRIICDSEQGIAILEPAQGGISIESTDEGGEMSGQIGGLTPGSYILECRSQAGFNLVDRVTVRVQGDVPNGFQGFPGAAGGNLGGGRVVDRTPDVDDGVGLRISSAQFTDAGGDTVQGPLDVSRNYCVSGSENDPCSITCSLEPFTFVRYAIQLKNDTAENVFVNTLEIALGSTTVVGAQGQAVEVKKGGGTATITGNFTSAVDCPASAASCYNGGSVGNTAIRTGLRNYTFTVTGVSESGNSFEVEKRIGVQFDYVNNCGSGVTASSSCPAIPSSCTSSTTTTTT